jgi:hypothetical protein
MPRDRAEWLSELTAIAPGIDRTMLRIIARVLTCQPSADLLLSVSDACGEATVELMLDGRVTIAAQMMALGGVVAGEATLRSRRGGVW